MSPQQERVWAMINQGLSREDICTELDFTRSHLKTVVCRLRKLGFDIPHARSGHTPWTAMPIAKLVAARESLRRAGVTRGLCRILAERFGMKEGTVKVRLWMYDKGGST